MSNPSKYGLRQTPQSKSGFFKTHDDSESEESDCPADCDCDCSSGDEEHEDSSTDESQSDSASSFIVSESDDYNSSDTFSPYSDDQSVESEYDFSEEDEDFFPFGTDDEAVIVEAQGYTDDASEEPKALGLQRGVQGNQDKTVL